MGIKIAQLVNSPESLRILIRAQIERLREAGFEVHCIAGPGEYNDTLRREAFVVHEVPLTRLLRPLDDVRAVRKLVRLFRTEGFSVVHTHTPKASVLGQLAARLAGVPHIIHTVHGLLSHDATPLLRLPLAEVVDRINCALSTAVLSQSREDVERAIRRRLCRREKIRVLGQGIDLGRFDPDRFPTHHRGVLREERGLPRHRFIVLIVARLSREKGYREFFAMARWLACRDPEVHFLVVGTSLDERDPIDPRPEPHGLLGRMTVLMDRRDMPEIYACADLLVLPTYREGFPRSVVEAAAMGIPVVTTGIRGCREAVADGETGLLVPPRDVPALCAAVESLRRDPDRRARMAAAARRKAAAEFDERQVCDRLLAVYRGVLRPNDSPWPASRHVTGDTCTGG